MFRILAVIVALTTAMPATAQSAFEPVVDEGEFLQLVEGRELRLGMFALSLAVQPDGIVQGRAMGWPVIGTWDWRDGLFCRELDWGGTEIPFNCQLVEVRGDNELRFTVDAGAGDSARFNLR